MDQKSLEDLIKGLGEYKKYVEGSTSCYPAHSLSSSRIQELIELCMMLHKFGEF